MPKSAWPTGAQLTAAVAALGASIPAGYTAADVVAATVQEWEGLTGWEPFLADAGTSTRQFDPTFNYTISLPGFHTVTAVTVAGVAKTLNVDYWPDPLDNASKKVPITGLRFNNALTGAPASISVTGRLGYDDDIHDDAWLAVLNKAVARCLEIASGASGSISELEQGLVKVKYGQEAGRSTIDRFKDEFTRVAMRYRRAEVY